VSDDSAIGTVRLDRSGAITFLTFDRPAARNSMTGRMYEELEAGLDRIADDGGIRVVVLRGANGSFVAGTDIAGFTTFRSGEDGLRYEHRIDDVVGRLEALPMPTVAVVEGFAAGAGLLFAAACDLRICTPDARFGAPIARTVGNCLSIASTARLIAHLGVSLTKRILLNADFLSATEALAAGFVLEVVEPDGVDERVSALCDRLASHAPITMAAAKEAVRRLVAAGIPDGDDLIRRVYGSSDFREGVAAFMAKRTPQWKGR
jgi:enoyl-CoA hydratase/carnithine racemase